MLAALDIKHVQEIFHAYIVRSECGRIIARETRGGARNGSYRVAVGCRVDQDDAIGVLVEARAV